MKKLLILGGVKDAVDLATITTQYCNLKTIYSLAGRTKNPHLPSCDTRYGGFGGVSGLIKYLEDNEIDFVVDASHPFAEGIAANTVKACNKKNIPCIKFSRPAWPSYQRNWILAESFDEAAKLLHKMGERIFLTAGSKDLEKFNIVKNKWFLVRLIEEPNRRLLLPNCKLILERGPFDLEHEKNILSSFNIDVLVTKNSGGLFPSKLIAAQELDIPIIMIHRPPLPEGIETVLTQELTLHWIEKHL